jgi:hypothetical protein
VVAENGDVAVWDGARKVFDVHPGIALTGWTGLKVKSRAPMEDAFGEEIALEDGGQVSIRAKVETRRGVLRVTYTMKTTSELSMESVHASVNTPVDWWLDAPYALGDLKGTVPRVFTGNVHLAAAGARSLVVGPAPALGGLTVRFSAEKDSPLLLQDSRKWWASMEMRMSVDRQAPWPWKPGGTLRLTVALSANRPIELVKPGEVTLKAGRDWVPYTPAYEIEAGSALDWSGQRPLKDPAGSKGWLRPSLARPGTMEFEGEPGIPVRIYANNLGTTVVHPTHEMAVKLADRLAREGYSAVRIHHYESPPWVKDAGLLEWSAPDSLTFNADRLEKFDFLVAELEKRGIYITTDIYVSRLVRAAEVFGPGQKDPEGYWFKRLVHVSDKAMENWKEFARRLLAHVNPYTGRAYADDPALFQIVLINEGNLSNEINEMKKDQRERSLWDTAFEVWKREKREAGDWDSPAFRRFLWETQQSTQRKLIRFLREELKVKAMLSDINGWTDEYGTQACRADFDFVDNHFYWDHPSFYRKAWELPVRGSSGGGSSVFALGGMDRLALTRLVDRPFSMSEINYCPPNDFRAEAGLVIGIQGALQDWSSMWRFAYSDAFTLQPMSFFDTVTDPVAFLSDYAAVALFARGDMDPAKHTVAFSATPGGYWARAGEKVGGPMADLRAVVKVGMIVDDGRVKDDPDRMVLPLSGLPGDREAVIRALAGLKANKFLPEANATDPMTGVWESETGQARFETGPGVVTVVTPRTVGMAGPAGTARAIGPVKASLSGSFAALWVSSLDGKPVADSGRMLLVHMTDVKQAGMKFSNGLMKDMLAWGGLPLLARTGKAKITLASSRAAELKVWRLAQTGKRLGKVKTTLDRKAGTLSFTAEVAKAKGVEPGFLYEIAKE